jgi:hypothetical protein
MGRPRPPRLFPSGTVGGLNVAGLNRD